MTIKAAQEKLRAELASLKNIQFPPAQWGKAAERLRGLVQYRQAKQIFVAPSDPLKQIRINALLDGQVLIMPGPGLKEGFFMCPPHSVPFKSLGHAVTYKGMPKFFKRLQWSELSGLAIDMAVTDAVAIDFKGGRLGDGKGFFDLAFAVLASLSSQTAQASLFAVVGKGQLLDVPLPRNPWDMRMDGVVTAEEVLQFTDAEARPAPAIYWDALPLKRIRKVSPLWEMYKT